MTNWKATDLSGIHPKTAHTFKVGVIGEIDVQRLDHLLSKKTNVEVVCHAENEGAIQYAKDRSYECSPRKLGKQPPKNSLGIVVSINLEKARAATIAGYCNAVVFFEECEYTRIYANRYGKIIK